ncbi:hypothetical protein Tsubulata_005573 [Turnera subulata]|uniref:Late embryogenesis abundant protein LEA-2 subgroup domain-containing protein n=1 Tax=Turnera subulata TaxID=218843 RepID=A0A9Q0F2L6_9ROSI|nr:hypothetical protein Tsubulata_005573 [Turnera subulata]
MAEKQPQLNGAYYGPSIPPPPPRHKYHRPGRGSGCGCCCWLLSLLCKLVLSLVVIIGLAALIFWLIFRPINKVKFHVTDVSLTEFNFTNNNNLRYNLSMDVTIRNPNKKIGVYYDRIEARAYYQDQRFSSVFLTPFYQGHKNTTVLHPVFQGQQLVLLGADETTTYNKEKTSGIYSIDIKLYLKIRFKLGKIKTNKFKPKMECDLKIPFNAADGRLAGGADSTKCKLDY